MLNDFFRNPLLWLVLLLAWLLSLGTGCLAYQQASVVPAVTRAAADPGPMMQQIVPLDMLGEEALAGKTIIVNTTANAQHRVSWETFYPDGATKSRFNLDKDRVAVVGEVGGVAQAYQLQNIQADERWRQEIREDLRSFIQLLDARFGALVQRLGEAGVQRVEGRTALELADVAEQISRVEAGQTLSEQSRADLSSRIDVLASGLDEIVSRLDQQVGPLPGDD